MSEESNTDSSTLTNESSAESSDEELNDESLAEQPNPGVLKRSRHRISLARFMEHDSAEESYESAEDPNYSVKMRLFILKYKFKFEGIYNFETKILAY